jgi:cysteine desulfurase
LKNLPIYLDYAATTPVCAEVLDSMLPYFTENFGNASSRHHAFGWLAEDAVEDAQTKISKTFSCKKNEIIFTSGATESINLALKGYFENFPKTCLITLKTEHKATLEVAEYLVRKAVEVNILGVNENGDLDLNELESEFAKGSALVSIMWVNNETGVIHPIEEIVKLKQKYDFELHVDATQAVGKIPIHFEGIDFLSFSAHKIYGPKGVGALLVNEKQKIQAQILGGGQQRGLRSGTLNIPGIVGIGKAVEISNSKIDTFNSHCQKLKDKFESEICSIYPSAQINGLKSSRVSNISNVCFIGKDGEDLMRKLHKIAISNGSACNSATTFPSHVLTAMGLSESDAFASLRFSFGWGNSIEQMDEVLNWIKDLIG